MSDISFQYDIVKEELEKEISINPKGMTVTTVKTEVDEEPYLLNIEVKLESDAGGESMERGSLEIDPLKIEQREIEQVCDYHEIEEDIIVGPETVQRTLGTVCLDHNHDGNKTLQQTTVAQSENSTDIESFRPCYLCETLVPNNKYDSHMLTHSKVKKLSCEICKINYIDKTKLLYHMMATHAEGTECKICNLHLQKESALQNHMSTHTGVNYTCDICVETFAYKTNLTVHLKKHSGGTVYPCNVCGKEFENPSGLNSHTRSVHTNEKPFSCDICHVRFARVSKMYRHKMSVHNRRHDASVANECDYCERTFLRAADLKRHCDTRHRDC